MHKRYMYIDSETGMRKKVIEIRIVTEPVHNGDGGSYGAGEGNGSGWISGGGFGAGGGPGRGNGDGRGPGNGRY